MELTTLFDDNSKMPFGQHKGTALINVPADYLMWCYGQRWVHEKYPELIDYIEDNYEAIRLELKP